MKRPIKFYINKGLLVKDESVKGLSKEYLDKAKNNLITLKILEFVQTDKLFRKKLHIPENYSTYEWIVITGYYVMYTAALSLLAKIGYRSKNHTATLCILEEFFVKKNILSQDAIAVLKSAMLHKEEIEKLSEARHKREIAQYSITKQTTKSISDKIKTDAYEFIDKVESIIQ